MNLFTLSDRPLLFDAANVGRRVKMGLARGLISQSTAGDSDEEDTSVMATFQEMLSLASSLSHSSKVKLAEMFSRSSLGQLRGLPLGGVMAQGFPPHHLQYPPQPRPAPPPPKPQIQPLKDLCQYPLPGQSELYLETKFIFNSAGSVENVGSITVTLEDYKTLAASTFLNDTIIDYYMKHLQYRKFSLEDRDRSVCSPTSLTIIYN